MSLIESYEYLIVILYICFNIINDCIYMESIYMTMLTIKMWNDNDDNNVVVVDIDKTNYNIILIN